MYFQDYMKAIELTQKIANIDNFSGIKNRPNFHIQKGELITIELMAHSLGGLSYLDFDLAIRIKNEINIDDYGVVV